MQKIIAFLCNWCSYAAADLAGTSRMQYPPNVRIIRVMCSGRVSPLHVLKAFQSGADAVLVAGCHIGDCHYLQGNLIANRRFMVFKKILQIFGIEPKRLKIAWVSAGEGAKFADLITEFTKELSDLKPVDELKKHE